LSSIYSVNKCYCQLKDVKTNFGSLYIVSFREFADYCVCTDKFSWLSD